MRALDALLWVSVTYVRHSAAITKGFCILQHPCLMKEVYGDVCAAAETPAADGRSAGVRSVPAHQVRVLGDVV